MRGKVEKKQLAILKVLQEAGRPLGSSRISEQLLNMGYELSERTVRFHLYRMDQEGLTENLGRLGRKITERGRRELASARVFEKVGFLTAKIDQMTYRMSFNLERRTGTVIINLSFIPLSFISKAITFISKVFSYGYSMGFLIGLFGPGEVVGEHTVPKEMIGVATVCSVTLNGVLLDYGIPTHSRFGGLLELEQGQPSRFVEIINYDGTSIDPLEIFIRSGMTNFVGATSTGDGFIGAGFREIPAQSRKQVIKLARELEKIGLGGFLAIGWPGMQLLEVPVSEGRIGVVVIGGLNPVAILEEVGIHLKSRAMAGLVDYSNLFPYQELENRVKEYL